MVDDTRTDSQPDEFRSMMAHPGVEQPVVSIVVVSYNTRELTLDCLRSVAEQTSIAHEVILIDNDSADGSADAVAQEFPDVLLLREHRNHGFAAANNIASQHAKGRLLLLLNPDTVVLDGAIDRLVDYADRHPGARIWGGRTLFPDRSLNPASCWRRMSVWSLFCRLCGVDNLWNDSSIFNAEGYGGWLRDTEREVDIVSGCFFLIDRSLWTEVRGFDPTFVMYGEEVDLCLRSLPLGARPRITPTATIVHYGGASETVRAAKHVRLLAAKSTLIRRHIPGVRRPVASALMRSWPISRAVAAGIAARLLKRESATDLAAQWREVWTRRSEWWNGYPDQPAARTEGTVR